MRRTICCLAWLLTPCAALATALPEVVLSPEDNLVLLSVVNDRDEPLVGVRAKVEPGLVPSGVTVVASEAIDVPAGSQADTKLGLAVYAGPEVEVAEFQLPVRLETASGDAWSFLFLVRLRSALPQSFELRPSAPNPFNPETSIAYRIGGGEAVRTSLRIYSSTGQLVRTLVDGVGSPGEHSVIWDGRDDRGQSVASGMYLYRLSAGQFVSTQRMMLAK